MTDTDTGGACGSDEEFVTSLYRAFFDRKPDPGGYRSHLTALSQGMTRPELFDAFLQSDEYATRSESSSFLNPKMVRDLCRFPIWALDTVAIEQDGSATVAGWIVGSRDDLSIGQISMNG